jgi:hypothetical protein
VIGLRFRKWAERVDVLRRAAGDCTAGGVSARFDSLWVIGPDGAPDGWQPRPTDPTPILQLVERRIRDIGADEVSIYYHVEPLTGPAHERRMGIESGMRGPMMGGNFVHTPGGDFRRMFPYPLPVHDRYERPEPNRPVPRARNAAGGEAADLGAQPIGSDCLRRHPELKPYARRDGGEGYKL